MTRKRKDIDPEVPAGEDTVAGTLAEVISAGEDTQPGDARILPPPAPPEVLIVRGPQRGRWRAGRHFGPDEVHIPVRDLTDDEFDAITTDPFLTHRRA